MNEIFLIGKIINGVEYKFMVEKNKTAKSILKIELLDKTKVEAIAYNEIADFCFRNLNIQDTVIIYAKINKNIIEIIEIETLR